MLFRYTYPSWIVDESLFSTHKMRECAMDLNKHFPSPLTSTLLKLHDFKTTSNSSSCVPCCSVNPCSNTMKEVINISLLLKIAV